MTKSEFTKIVGHHRRKQALATKFREVMEFYNEAKENASSYGSVDYEQALSTGGASSGCVVGKIVMSSSDFVSDVEINARRVLSPVQLKLFKLVYMCGGFTDTQNTPDSYKKLDVEVQEIMGKTFIDVGISPTYQYMRSFHVEAQ